MSFDQDRAGYESNNRQYDDSPNNDHRAPPSANSNINDETSRRLDAALHSPYGIDKLLNRLKQSIYSAREFSSFLGERCALEDRHAQGHKKLVRHTLESIRRTEARQGSFVRHFDESLKLNDRLADNGLALASSLHTMSEELRDVAANAEKGRKHWKHTTIDAEKRLADAESAQQKAKDRYNNAADQYDKVRTGEKQGGKFGLKNKSPAQQEEALKEKADALDREYATKFEAAQSQKQEFEGTTRPDIVRALKELIDECDAAVAMQMAKFASVSEKHVVSNGMAIAPIKTADSNGEPRGLRHIARDIDDRKDFTDYMLDGVEPPPQFKGRSRRNTDAEIIQTPVQRTDTMEGPYNASQSNVESRPPQLPQIGGSESFSRSFEAERPAQPNRNSYLGKSTDALGGNPTYPSQQTAVPKDPAPSLPTGRGAPTVPSLPSYDRGQAPTTDILLDTNNGQNRGQNQARQDTMGPAVGQGRTSMDETPRDRDRQQGPGRYGPDSSMVGRENPYMGDQAASQPPKQQQSSNQYGPDAGMVGRENPYMTDRFADQTQQQTNPMFGEHSQKYPTGSSQNYAQDPGRQDLASSFAGRGQPTGGSGQPSFGAPTNIAGNYQPKGTGIGGSPDAGKSQSFAAGTGFGQGIQAPGAPPAGRGGALAGRSGLPSQQQQLQPPRPTLPPNRPVFGMHLDDLFRRDGSAVPTIVFQCIQAVDTFGLTTQGIYRVSGSSPAVQQLKSEFDHDSNLVDLSKLEAFNHDIAAVATLLKNFLRDLPDPLLTGSAYHSFLQAARYEDPIQRRDALHQYINSLPDANYATLRVLVLHLHRVSVNSETNMMDIKNLAIVFGPTVMGGGNMSDTGLQTKVMETILHHTHDIFDPDEE